MSDSRFRIACIQLNAGPDRAANLATATRLISDAADTDARLICLPEAVDGLEEDLQQLASHAQPLATHPAISAFRHAACTHRVWILVGSVTALDEQGQTVNRCVLLDDDGEVRAHYDKIHLFDAAPGDVRSVESEIYRPGHRAVVTSTPWARIGLSICYDLRFPHLFRTLAQHGATILFVPAAFMQVTGRAHWHALLRARAIENGCFVVAPAQCGNPYGTRQSYGHSLIVDPWGVILAEAGESPGFVTAECDLSLVESARRAIPSLRQDRPFQLAP